MIPDDSPRTDGRNTPSPALGDGSADAFDCDPATIPVVHPVRLLWCWRCGETAEPVRGMCPWCGTWTDGTPPEPEVLEAEVVDEDDWHERKPRRAIPIRPADRFPRWVVVLIAYLAMLGVSVGFLIYAAVSQLTTPEEIYTGTAVVEFIDTIITVVALAIVWRASRQKLPEATAGYTWVIAFPALFALLCTNIAFVTVLRELLRPFGAAEPERTKVTFVTVMLICVQPAIVEELFFRQMTLGVLRKSLNLHLAVWLTAMAFALAHIFNPIGMPYLFFVGAFLGYCRVFGGLPLVILLHFVHNFVVIAYEAWK